MVTLRKGRDEYARQLHKLGDFLCTQKNMTSRDFYLESILCLHWCQTTSLYKHPKHRIIKVINMAYRKTERDTVFTKSDQICRERKKQLHFQNCNQRDRQNLSDSFLMCQVSFKTRLDEALRNLIQWEASLPMALDGIANPSCSMIQRLTRRQIHDASEKGEVEQRQKGASV